MYGKSFKSEWRNKTHKQGLTNKIFQPVVIWEKVIFSCRGFRPKP
jgi:hypothetical protein